MGKFRVQKVFSPPLIVYSRSARKKQGRWQGCGSSRCQVWKSINVTRACFTSKKTWKINDSFECNHKCVIYLLGFKSCGKQYVGNNTDRFKSRQNNYESDVRKAESGNMENVKQKFLQSQEGFLNDLELRLIDETHASDPSKREFQWIRTLRSLHPGSLNIESEYQ